MLPLGLVIGLEFLMSAYVYELFRERTIIQDISINDRLAC
jgi:hypothetical protein